VHTLFHHGSRENTVAHTSHHGSREDTVVHTSHTQGSREETLNTIPHPPRGAGRRY